MQVKLWKGEVGHRQLQRKSALLWSKFSELIWLHVFSLRVLIHWRVWVKSLLRGSLWLCASFRGICRLCLLLPGSPEFSLFTDYSSTQQGSIWLEIPEASPFVRNTSPLLDSLQGRFGFVYNRLLCLLMTYGFVKGDVSCILEHFFALNKHTPTHMLYCRGLWVRLCTWVSAHKGLIHSF